MNIYKLRHNLLELFFKRYEDYVKRRRKEDYYYLTVDELEARLKLLDDPEDHLDQVIRLGVLKYIETDVDSDPVKYWITPEGISAYLDNVFIKTRWDIFWEYWSKRVTTVAATIGMSLGLASFVITLNQKASVKLELTKLQDRLSKQEKEILKVSLQKEMPVVSIDTVYVRILKDSLSSK